MTLTEKQNKALEIETTLCEHSHELSEKEYIILRNELNNLYIQIRAEESIQSGEWKDPVISFGNINTLRKNFKR